MSCAAVHRTVSYSSGEQRVHGLHGLTVARGQASSEKLTPDVQASQPWQTVLDDAEQGVTSAWFGGHVRHWSQRRSLDAVGGADSN